nr:GNAT family N-acetyltransferase [Allomuricauda sp.]
MKIKEGEKFYKLKLLWSRIRHGLLLMTIKDFLVKLGIDMGPYFWVLEGSGDCMEPKIRGDFENLQICYLTPDEIAALKDITFFNSEDVLRSSQNGRMKVVALKHENQVAAVTCVKYDIVIFKKKSFHLSSHEAYLLNMYTYQSYRGKNIAPYLRYHTYQMLKKEGVQKIYSITDYFNRSSRKFKSKLNAKPLNLYFAIVLFKKLHGTYMIKRYRA